VGRWIESREAHFLVALDDQMIAAAGAITRKGEFAALRPAGGSILRLQQGVAATSRLARAAMGPGLPN